MKKKCFKCLRELPISEFYTHKAMADGHLNKCKKCTTSDVRKNYADNREEWHERDRLRFKTKKRKIAVRDSIRKMRANNPEKTKARAAIRRAVLKGDLVRMPCEVCGSKEQIQAHHDDYTKPLDVHWFCFRCHREHAHDQIVTLNTSGPNAVKAI